LSLNTLEVLAVNSDVPAYLANKSTKVAAKNMGNIVCKRYKSAVRPGTIGASTLNSAIIIGIVP
jgi:hypothetical protein